MVDNPSKVSEGQSLPVSCVLVYLNTYYCL